MLNAGGTTENYDTNLRNSGPIHAISKDLIAASEDLPQKRPKIWGKSLVSASPKLRANNSISKNLIAAPEELPQKRLRIWCKSKTNMIH